MSPHAYGPLANPAWNQSGETGNCTPPARVLTIAGSDSGRGWNSSRYKNNYGPWPLWQQRNYCPYRTKW